MGPVPPERLGRAPPHESPAVVVVVDDELDDASLEPLSELDELSELEVGMVTTGLSGATICVGGGDEGATVSAVGPGGGEGDEPGGVPGGAVGAGTVADRDEEPDVGRGATGPGDAGLGAADGAFDAPFTPLAMVVTGAATDRDAGGVARPTGADAGSDAGADDPRPMDATDAASRAKARNPR